ncbi:hypothetical protein [Nostoc sp. 'Lobaria pulmonaria (5183) cyanobiont']|uniref:hypothetical protein n=1 Tax=Nostoc sp. 'Lobaria pulmonaria (5183) cyanobiont' TaxID=1618022 RepID=UPI00131A2F9B|nr:hypothetical protein [Nostoc sp. 'Lobaria pulmonaria (5183) cyanobiont']
MINYEEVNPGEALKQMTGGCSTDFCIDAASIEADHIFQQKKDNSIKVILQSEW